MSDYIVIKNVNKSFKGIRILDDVSATFEKGSITGIIGRNGSGKTVLLKIICGLLKADSGEIIIAGKNISEQKGHPESIGAVIENPGFIPYKSAYSNLKYLADIQKKIGKEEIISVIKQVGLDPYSKKHVGKYSLGMKQRLGIAQAIMENPELVILDEPMNGLDSHGVTDVRNMILSLKKEGRTIIITSHHQEDIDILCDKVFEMDAGKICNSGRKYVR